MGILQQGFSRWEEKGCLEVVSGVQRGRRRGRSHGLWLAWQVLSVDPETCCSCWCWIQFQRKEERRKKMGSRLKRERKRKCLCWVVVWIYFQLNIRLSLWRSGFPASYSCASSILCHSSLLFPFVFLSLSLIVFSIEIC